MSLERGKRVTKVHRRTESDNEYRHRKRRNYHPLSSHHIPMDEYIPPDAASSSNNLRETAFDSLTNWLKEITSQDDLFQIQVAEKTQRNFIGQQEATVEVLIDMIVKTVGSKDKALLYVVSEAGTSNENKVQILVNTLLHQGANPSVSNAKLKTALHYAVEKNFRGVCSKLLEDEATPNPKDHTGDTPFTIAYNKDNDAIASMLIANMPNKTVRKLYTANGTCPSEFSFHSLIQKDMQNTILAVLDCLIEPQIPSGHLIIYYHILESDEKGRTPKQKSFNKKSKSPLQIIAKSGNKTLVCHDVVRLLIMKKWKDFARCRFQLYAILYLVTLLAFTYSVIVAVTSPDVLVYDTPLQVGRGVTECWTYLMAFQTFLLELNEIRMHKLEYWHDPFNWIDLLSTILILTVLPLRLLRLNEQWPVISVAFLFWTLRIFEHAVVFRQTGAYVQILWRILVHDILQFIVLFLVVLLAFGGSFILSLKGEHSVGVHNDTNTFWNTLFLGVRILTEGERIIEYTELGIMSCIIMVMFLFTCCVILLNILIAQLSDTYQNVQQDAQRGLEANIAWIIARLELNSLKDYRSAHYQESENIPDIREVLDRWESPPLNEMNKNIQDIYDSLNSHKMNFLTVRNRLARQESTLGDIQKQLERLITLQTEVYPKTKL